MFVRNLSRNCSPQKKLHIWVSLFFFHFCRKEKWKKKHVHRVGRGERKERRMEEDAATTGATGAPLPLFSLYEERALTGARWLCAFLKHQLPEWSCREAMHCGTGASSFFLPPAPTATPCFVLFFVSSSCHISTCLALRILLFTGYGIVCIFTL